MLALSAALSFTEIIKMPMGGGVTLLSMLPVMLISVRYGVGTGLCEAFAFSLFNLLQGLLSGNVFVFCEGAAAVVTVVLFDYILPFSLLGLCGLSLKIKRNAPCAVAGIFVCILFRFVCHYVTGVVIWGQWAEDMSVYLYSLVYNGSYLLPEAVLTCAGAAAALKVPQIKKLTGLTEKKNTEEESDKK